MPDICLRCGKAISWGHHASEVTLHGETGRQHAECGEFHRGTAVHYRHEPEQHTRQEVYSHDWGDGVTHVFNVSSLRWRAIKGKRRTINVPVELRQIEGLMKARTMTPDDVQAVMMRRIRQGTFDAPGVLVYHPHKGGSLIVDGNHRYVGRAILGETQMQFYVFDLEEVGLDMLSGVDPSLLERFAVTDTRWGA